MQSTFQIGLDVVRADLYVDALPDDDAIIDALANLNIQLDLGSAQLSLATPIENDPNSDPEQSRVTQFNQQRLKVNLAGIQINKPTCKVIEQTVILSPISSGAFSVSKNAAIPQPFALDISCNGYLNERNFLVTMIDNNQLSNQNQIGYLSNAKGADYSNVGIQLRDPSAVAINIGSETELLLKQSGSQFSKILNAQYYLPANDAKVGRVFAQAMIMLSYK